MEGRAVMRVGDDPHHILCGHHLKNAGDCRRCARVYGQDAGVCVHAAYDLGVQHPGQDHVVRVVGGARDLGARFEAVYAPAYLALWSVRVIHAWLRLRRSAASMALGRATLSSWLL